MKATGLVASGSVTRGDAWPVLLSCTLQARNGVVISKVGARHACVVESTPTRVLIVACQLVRHFNHQADFSLETTGGRRGEVNCQAFDHASFATELCSYESNFRQPIVLSCVANCE